MHRAFEFPQRMFLDLSFAPPHADRLSRIIPALAADGVLELVIDWEWVFPWTIDMRMRGPGAFTEESVAGVCAVAERSALSLVPRLARGGLIRALDRVPPFAHLTDLACDPGSHREYAAAGVRMAERVWEDLCSISGEPARVMLGTCESPGTAADLFRSLVSEPVASLISAAGVSVEIEECPPPRRDGPIEAAIAATVKPGATPAIELTGDTLVGDILAVARAVAELDTLVATTWVTIRRVSEALGWAVRDPGIREMVEGRSAASAEVTDALADLDRVRARARALLRGGMDEPVVADYLSRRCAAAEELLVVLAARLRAIG